MNGNELDSVVSIFDGLTQEQIDKLTKERCYVHVPSGQVIFNEGDAAFGLFIVVSGSVDIVHPSKSGDVPIAQLATGTVFGELGLLLDAGTRTATARAIGDTTLLGIPIDPGDLFAAIADTDTAIRLLQNLTRLLGERLRNASDARTASGASPVLVSDLQGQSAEKVRRILQRPETKPSLLTRLRAKKQFKYGEYLFRQGDESGGFFLVHSGVLEVIDEADGMAPRLLTLIHAPNIVGEVGFFSGRSRMASCRAIKAVECTYFSGSEFEELRRKDARKALEIMYSAAQLTVQLIVERRMQLYSGH